MFKGVGTALITPFKKDQTVDTDSLRKIVNQQLDGGVDALVVMGTTGESPVIEFDERKVIISQLLKKLKEKFLLSLEQVQTIQNI